LEAIRLNVDQQGSDRNEHHPPALAERQEGQGADDEKHAKQYTDDKLVTTHGMKAHQHDQKNETSSIHQKCIATLPFAKSW
jgi:hypothetical protein